MLRACCGRQRLRYYRVAASIPVLLLGQVLTESRFGPIVRHLREIDILKPPKVERLDSIIARLVRWRDPLTRLWL